MYGFKESSDKINELATFKKLAAKMLNYDDAELARAIEQKVLIEVCDEQKISQ